MQRRDFITLLGGAIAAPGAALAQPTKVYRVGVLLLGNADAASFQTQLREGLGKSGYLETQTCCSNSDRPKASLICFRNSRRSWSRSR